ncbi:hypothetical protein BJ322DRAFT_1017954 [Thelephora terrestris]|uniref:Uncharacterized protein n=1 Tax=Thelephora terrestris TaxID=56493 RepID=A0A9P6HK64_9AGAM|nr:hypothetical protein BJ322DRAFT_1017954 [Thelephora terrestris]
MVAPKRQSDKGAPETSAKKQKQGPPTGSRILAALDDAGLGLKKQQELENEDDAEEAMVTGRPRGAKNYSHGELELLVACMKEIAPITSQDFAAVAELYNRLANEKGFTTRGAAPLRQRFEKLQKTKPDDGNPQNKKLYEAAKAITLGVETKAGMKTLLDGPTRALHMEEAFRKILQDDDSDRTEAPSSDTRIKHSIKKSDSERSIIDLTAASSEGDLSKADDDTKAAVKKEAAEDVTAMVAKEKKEKGKGSGGNVVSKTYRHGDGKVMGKAAVTETALGAVANHLSPEAQEKREVSRINLLRESRLQDRQDRMLEEREKEISDLKKENNTLREPLRF